jgi:hypothetical protein
MEISIKFTELGYGGFLQREEEGAPKKTVAVSAA